MALMKTLRRRVRSERGAELIELAMVTPILLLVIGGIVDFGFLFRSWQVITNAAREGARVGVLPNYTCNANAGSDVVTRVNAYLDSSGVSGAVVQAVTSVTGGVTSCVVRVSLNQPLPSLGVFGQFFGGNFGSVPLASTATMRTEVQAP
jgi:Flp pilus assembly protein TadG